ncbi:MAG: PcfJ domain-containing protein, partial [Alphaproteobacteria bacterium]|nr:PcfJ domain-containing protein [Alphaproteobacteria bacterium]
MTDPCQKAQWADDLLVQIQRYHRSLHTPLLNFALQSGPKADLCETFPAAAIVLVTEARTAAARALAEDVLSSRAGLARLAAVLDLPFWARRLPPEAFGATAPEAMRRRADDVAFGRRLAAAFPPRCARGAPWADMVMHARAVASDEFAVWMALHTADFDVVRTDVLGAFAWHSVNAQSPGAQHMGRRWRPRQSGFTAAQLAAEWLISLVLRAQKLSSHPAVAEKAPWRADGLEIHLLDTAERLVEEGRAMGNCIATYAARVALGRRALLSVRRGRNRIADVEVRLAPSGGPLLVSELKGPRNCRLPDADEDQILTTLDGAWRAGWIDGQLGGEKRITQRVWKRLLGPYLDTVQGANATIAGVPDDAGVGLAT